MFARVFGGRLQSAMTLQFQPLVGPGRDMGGEGRRREVGSVSVTRTRAVLQGVCCCPFVDESATVDFVNAFANVSVRPTAI